MNNEELKKKIAQIISEYCCPYGKTHKQLYGDDRMCYSKMNFAECNSITECTDALIAAGIGDVKESEIERKAYEVASNHYRTQYEEQKDRAEVAERALRNAAPRLKCRGGLGKGFCRVDKCDYYHCNNDEGCVKAHLQQAEKELAEERKS